MLLAAIGLGVFVMLILAYGTYGRYLSRHLELSDDNITPAHKNRDGIDFVPARRFYLFGQHFSAIAAAGPIAGPIMACAMWGYLPCLIWIALGVVLIGAVHDFLSLTISVRHGAVSIASVAKIQLGHGAGLAMLIFIWLALIYVIVAFTDITAASFVGITEELQGGELFFNPGGAVAAAAIMYLGLSLVLGFIEHFLKPKMWIITIIFVPLTFVAVWLGTQISTLLILDAKTWCLLILAYCLLSSMLPVWMLLQPRGYLGGFILYTALLVGACGIFFGNYEIKQAAFTAFDAHQMTGALFPFLFVTIACGACSGFHGLVCSGTTAKQIDKESHMQAVGYGAMLSEAMVALIALATIMIWAPHEIIGLKPGTIYGNGIGEFMTLFVGKENLRLAITFGAMAFSTFVFDTLDVSTRLGRYLVQELFGRHSKTFALIATLITVGLPMILIELADRGSYLQFWTLFGASNQLLAGLTLLSITMWLHRARKRLAYTLLPMLFVLCVSLWALGDLALSNLRHFSHGMELINGLVALSLIALAIFMIISALIKVRSESSAFAKDL